MIAVFTNAEDIALVIVCIAAGILAFVFFFSILFADVKDLKRRRDARLAFERAQKHFKKPEDPAPQTDGKPVQQ